MKERLTIKGLIVLSSGALWAGAVLLHDRLFPMLAHSAGIDILFLPSGIRLILLLIGGFWAAVGVTLSSLFLTGAEFGTADVGPIAVISLFSGFAPYFSMLITLRLLRVHSTLGNLAAWHLPLLSLGVAVGSSVLHNLLFWSLGVTRTAALPGDVIAMTIGDFCGSLIAVALAVGLIRIYRRGAPRKPEK